ncbi:MAG: OB-fold nucleic acid binding domain-containing protein, partial [Pelagibacteraceae bacterium]
MNTYRTHTCGQLNINDKGSDVVLSGWIHKKRDHGNLLFIDLRDNYGITQCVIEKSHKSFANIEKIPLETVVSVQGKVLERSKETINEELKTGAIELSIESYNILGECEELPLPVFLDDDYSEEIRLKYRYLDLRRKRIHQNIILRSEVVSFIRDEMKKMGFLEFQTPILTSSSP